MLRRRESNMALIPYDVVEAFANKKHKIRGSFVSNGTSLHSYGLLLAVWDKDGISIQVARDYKNSLTTNRHMNAMWSVLEKHPYKDLVK